jgi:hypothetical protein
MNYICFIVKIDNSTPIHRTEFLNNKKAMVDNSIRKGHKVPSAWTETLDMQIIKINEIEKMFYKDQNCVISRDKENCVLRSRTLSILR